MAAKTMSEVVRRPSAEDGHAAKVEVAAKATADGGGVVGRWRRPQRQSSWSASVTIQRYQRPSQHRRKLEQYQPKQ